MDKLLCGIDIGGTKCYCVLFERSGQIFAQRKTPGSTPVDLSFERVAELYRDAVLGAFLAAGNREIDAFYISVATYEIYQSFMDKVFNEAISEGCSINGQAKKPKLKVEPDGLCLISGELGHFDGASMICGTGSSLYVRSGEEYFRVGGWGQYFGSVGSGFQLASLSIKAAFKAHDGIIGPTLLTDLLSKQAGRPIWDKYDDLYAGGRAYVASYARCLFEAVKNGDETAKEIFHYCASELAELPAAAQRRAGKPLTIVMNGGIFSHYPEYAAEVQRLSPSDTKFIVADTPPVFGCAIEAMHMLDLDCLANKTFKEFFSVALN